MDILSLAFYLSVLSYCLGALLRALPLPFFTLKKLGRTLMVDGVFSAVLVFSYRTLVSVIDYLGSVLGTDWASFMQWVADRSSLLFLVLSVFKATSVIASEAGLGPVFSGIISSIVNLVTTSLTTLLTVSIIALILRVAAGFLIALGILLISVPFRLARGAGAMIIALVIVFSAGTPLMPQFIATVTSGVMISYSLREPVCSATLSLVDAKDYPVGYAVIEGYRDEEFLYRYVFNERGLLVVDKSSGGFPCSEHRAFVEIAGIKYEFTLPGFQSSGYTTSPSRTLKLPDLIVLDTIRVVELGSGISVTNYSKVENTLVLHLEASRSTYFGVYIESSDTLQVLINGVVASESSVVKFTWYNISYTALKYELEPGTYLVNITINYQARVRPDVLMEPFVLTALQVDVFSPEYMVFYVTYMFVELTILPLIYIAILLVISYGVARLLGGVSTSIAKYLVAV